MACTMDAAPINIDTRYMRLACRNGCMEECMTLGAALIQESLLLLSSYTAQASEIRKHSNNDGKCGDLGWVCIPLIIETHGVWGQEAVKSFAQLASITCSKPKSVIIHDLYGSLNTCLVRSVVSAILCRIESIRTVMCSSCMLYYL